MGRTVKFSDDAGNALGGWPGPLHSFGMASAVLRSGSGWGEGRIAHAYTQGAVDGRREEPALTSIPRPSRQRGIPLALEVSVAPLQPGRPLAGRARQHLRWHPTEAQNAADLAGLVCMAPSAA